MAIVRRPRWIVLLAVLALAGCASGLAPSASITTTTQGWEHYFRIEAEPTGKPDGVDLDGYIYNLYGRPATVRVLGQSLDASGNVIGQKIEWVAGAVPQLGRAYFRVPGLPRGDQYRVTVWSFDVIDAPGRLRF